MLDTLDLENLEMAPVFLAYGKACYSAQMLESTFRHLLILNKSATEGELITEKSILEIEEETKRYTLNKIFRLAQKREYFTSREVSILINANKDRNYLIHDFWEESANIILTVSTTGREELTNKLFQYVESLNKAGDITISLIDRYLKDYGLSTKILEEISPEIVKIMKKKGYYNG